MRNIFAAMVAGIGLLVFMSGCASQTDSIGTEAETVIFWFFSLLPVREFCYL